MTVANGPGGAQAGSGSGQDPQGAPRRGGPPSWFFLVGATGVVIAVLLLVLQGLGIGVRVGAPAATLAPVGDAAGRTHAQVVAALERVSFQVREPQSPYRPGEGPSVVDVPRRTLQVVLPSDPAGGFVVIYELPTNGEADRVGREFLTYLASGAGAIGYPRDTRFVLQRLGPTLVFFPWSAEANPDPRLAEMAAALEAIGTKVMP